MKFLLIIKSRIVDVKNDYIRGVTEISTLNLTSNKTRHDEQFFYVRLFSKRQFFLAFSPP
jgi:hypothetical protein